MGRKIPAKKHRGVKDPLEQQARRLQVLKTKINAPPKDPDEQPVPRSLTQLFAFQDVGPNKPKRKRTCAPANYSDSRNAKNPISGLRKLPGESGRGFSLRINSAMKALHQASEPLDYPHDLDEDDEKGARMAEQRARRERKRRRGAARGPAAAAALSRTQRLALKKKEKKQHALEEAAAERRAQPHYERVAFGDVAAAPPTLTAPRRAIPSSSAPRPGRRALLLTSLLAGGAAAGGAEPARGGGPSASAGERLRRERARLEAVAAYRDIKAQKRRNQNDTHANTALRRT